MPLADDEIPITSYGTGSDKEAAVTVWIRRSEDNYAAPEQIGYRVEIVSGNAPRGLAYGVPAVQVDRLGLDNPPAARVEIGA